jgi:hypothetical protein
MSDLIEVVCQRCENILDVCGPVDPEYYICTDCADVLAEQADAHGRAQWHGGNGPQSERERDEVRR